MSDEILKRLDKKGTVKQRLEILHAWESVQLGTSISVAENLLSEDNPHRNLFAEYAIQCGTMEEKHMLMMYAGVLPAHLLDSQGNTVLMLLCGLGSKAPYNWTIMSGRHGRIPKTKHTSLINIIKRIIELNGDGCLPYSHPPDKKSALRIAVDNQFEQAALQILDNFPLPVGKENVGTLIMQSLRCGMTELTLRLINLDYDLQTPQSYYLNHRSHRVHKWVSIIDFAIFMRNKKVIHAITERKDVVLNSYQRLHLFLHSLSTGDNVLAQRFIDQASELGPYHMNWEVKSGIKRGIEDDILIRIVEPMIEKLEVDEPYPIWVMSMRDLCREHSKGRTLDVINRFVNRYNRRVAKDNREMSFCQSYFSGKRRRIGN